MPHWLRYYVLQDTIYFIVYKCLRYRVGVVTENLRNSFPDRPMAEIKRIRRSFYHNLSEIFISTVSQAAMSDCRRRVRVKNLDEVLSDLRGRDALLSTAHFGCWEYDSFLALYTGEHYLAAVYHPLENKVIDAVYMRLRRRRNIRLIPMKEIIRYYIDHRLPTRILRCVPTAIGSASSIRIPSFSTASRRWRSNFTCRSISAASAGCAEGITSWSSCASTTAWSRSRPTR